MDNMMNVSKKESKLQEIFKEGDPKSAMILYAISAVIWMLCAAMSYHSIVAYGSTNRISLYIDGFLALFNLGMSLGKAYQYSKSKKELH